MHFSERGLDSKQILEELVTARKDIQRLEKNLAKTKHEMTQTINDRNNEIQNLKDQLIRQQERVIKPLVTKLAEREAEFKKVKQLDQSKGKYMKILQAMLRSPKMCDIFYKAE